MFRKIKAIVQSTPAFLLFVNEIKHCGKLLFFVISENIHSQNSISGSGRSAIISWAIAYYFLVY
jgi:hypothetical protein